MGIFSCRLFRNRRCSRKEKAGWHPAEVDDALDIGIHAVADIDNASVPAAFLDLGKFDVFQTAYSANAFQLVEFRPQAAVYRRIDDRLLQGSTYDGSFGQVFRKRFFAVSKQVSMQHFQGVPGVTDRDNRIVSMFHDLQQGRIFHPDGVTFGL